MCIRDSLQLFLLGRKTRLRCHAFLRLDREGEHERLDNDREQDNRHAVVLENRVKEPQQVAEYAAKEIKNLNHSFKSNPCLLYTSNRVSAL